MKAYKNYRYYVLFLLLVATMIGTMAAPEDSLNMVLWLVLMLFSKICAFLCGWLTIQLYKYWDAADEIPELTNLVEHL